MDKIELTPKQTEFISAILSGKYNYIGIAGSIRFGKTFAALCAIYILCRIYPKSRWAIVRKDLPTLRRNTVPVFEKTRPNNFVDKINQSTWTAKCKNGSEILFFPESFSIDQDLDRWKGLEVNGFIFEEAHELNEKSFDKAIERAGAWIIQDGKQPPPMILLTANPGPSWFKMKFYDKYINNTLKPPWLFIPAKITDNPHLPKSYLKSLNILKETSPENYRRFVLGDWNAGEDPCALIKYEWINNALSSVDFVRGPKFLGVDVGHFGPDKTVWAIREGNALKSIKTASRTSIPDVVEKTSQISKYEQIEGKNIRIDGVGLGAGAVDYLRHQEKLDVYNVISGGKPLERVDNYYTFRNLRSQIWWEFSQMLREGIISIDFEDVELFAELTSVRYEIVGDKMISIEKKSDLKKRLGRSPDKADAVIYAFMDTYVKEAPPFVLI